MARHQFTVVLHTVDLEGVEVEADAEQVVELVEDTLDAVIDEELGIGFCFCLVEAVVSARLHRKEADEAQDVRYTVRGATVVDRRRRKSAAFQQPDQAATACERLNNGCRDNYVWEVGVLADAAAEIDALKAERQFLTERLREIEEVDLDDHC